MIIYNTTIYDYINDIYINHYITYMYIYIIYYSDVIGSQSTLNFSFFTLVVLVAPQCHTLL